MGKEFSLDETTAGEAEQIASQMPSPSEHALSQMEETQVSGGDDSSGETSTTPASNTDDFGTVFDPLKHTGSKLKNGAWRERKKSTVAAPRKKKDAAPQPSAADLKKAENEAQCRGAGVVAAGTMFMLCRGIMGEEWQPTADEVAMQNEAWGNYFVAKGVSDVPPGMALALGIGAYVAPRLTKPKTQEKLGRAKTWIALRFARWKIRRELKKRGITATVTIENGGIFINGTRADSWNDGERQDNESTPPRR